MLAVTGESREAVFKFLAQRAPAMPEYAVGTGGGLEGYVAEGLPAAWLVGVDGRVIWQGHPNALPGKEIEAALRRVARPTEDVREARARRTLDHATALAGEKRWAEAHVALLRTAREWKGTEAAKEATARAAALEKSEDARVELQAQRELARLVGGSLDAPRERLKPKERDIAAVALEAFVRRHGETAPVAVEMARLWLRVMREEWKRH